MSHRFLPAVMVMTLVLVSLASVRVGGQTSREGFVAAAGTAGGGAQTLPAVAKPWSPARLPDGQPDVQGVGYWAAKIGADEADDIEKGSDPIHATIMGRPALPSNLISDPPDRTIPYTAAAAAIKNRRLANRHHPTDVKLRDPIARCLLGGVPRFQYLSQFQLLQTPGYVVFLYQFEHAFRVVPLDGRPPVADNIKLWMGDSRGRWEGNTLVIEVRNHNDLTWFDQAGGYHSDALYVVERLTFVDADTISYEATFQDPKAYTKPWKIAFPIVRHKETGFELLEDACFEGVQGDAALYAPRGDSPGKTEQKPQ